MTTESFNPAIVVPVFNHGRALAQMLPELLRVDLPVIAIDDGSDGATKAQLAALAAAQPALTLLSHEENEGKGAAVITGMRHAAARGFTHVLQIDADGQHEPADLPRFLAVGRSHPEAMVLGRPLFDASIPVGRRFGRHFTQFWICIETLSLDIRDAMCGYRLYPLTATLPVLESRGLGRRMDFDPEVLVRLHWRGTPFLEITTPVHYPESGSSNFRMLNDNLLITWMHTRLFFGMLRRAPRIIAARWRRRDAGGHWAAMAERGSYLGLRILLGAYRWFGRRLFSAVSVPIAGYYLVTAGTARRASREFLDRVWRTSAGQCGLAHAPTLATSFRHFREFTEAALDKVAAWNGQITLDRIDHENLALFEQRYRSGQGAVWITSHLGNIEVCRAIGQQQAGLALTVLVHTRHAENFNRLLKEAAPESDVELLEVTDFNVAMAMKLQQRVAAGRFIILVGDRVPVGMSERVAEVDFLGAGARFPTGPFILASLLRCPAGTLFCVKESDRFRMFIDDLPGLADSDRRSRQQSVERAIEVYAGRLESLCRRYPLQWFNFFPFWSTGRPSD